MIARQTSKAVVFRHPFVLKGVDRTLPPRTYRVTDKGQIEELSFPVYRRVARVTFAPAGSIDPRDLQATQELELKHAA
jgi:hypothetical protein